MLDLNFKIVLLLTIGLISVKNSYAYSAGSHCSGTPQYLPDPTDCSGFFQCANNSLIKQLCPVGLSWNSKINVCDWPYNFPPCQGQGNGDVKSCGRDQDCTLSEFGSLSRCNSNRLTCECWDVITGGKNEVVLYKGKCLYKRRLGEFCEKDEECKAGAHQNANCKLHPSYLPGQKICQCPGNDMNICDGDWSGEGWKNAGKAIKVPFTLKVLALTFGILTIILGV